MRLLLIEVLPWLLSLNTIVMNIMVGNKNKWSWALGLAGQVLWLVWILMVEAWGLIPLNLALWVIYIRNHIKWRKP